jgi:hypothetical protein
MVLAELMLGQTADLVSAYERRRRGSNAASIRPPRLASWE